MKPPTEPISFCPRDRIWARIRTAVLIAAFVAYGIMLARHVGAYAGGSDSSGYLNNARLLREHRTHVPQRILPGLPASVMPEYAYIPLGFVPVRANTMVPSYPIGFSLFIVATSSLTGWSAAPHVTLWLHAMAGLLLVFALARQAGLTTGWAAFGTLLLAASPLYVFMSLQAMSDVPAMTWVTASIVFAAQSRRRNAWAVLAGIAFAIAVLVRPTNVFAAVPVAILLGLNGRRWMGWIIGGVPGALALAVYNRSAYGNALASGYGSISELLTRDVVVETLRHYATWLPVLLTPLVVTALGLPWLWKNGARLWVAVLAGWIVAFLGFYTFYYHTHETWWYLRFILPAFPAFIVAALLVWRRIAERCGHVLRGWTAPTLAALAVLFVAGWSHAWNSKFYSWDIGHGEAAYGRAAAWAMQHLAPDTVIAAMQTTGTLFYYTDFTFVRWDQLQPKDVAAVEHAVTTAHRPLVAMLFPFEEKEALHERMPGQWTKLGAVDQTTFWRWDGPGAGP